MTAGRSTFHFSRWAVAVSGWRRCTYGRAEGKIGTRHTHFCCASCGAGQHGFWRLKRAHRVQDQWHGLDYFWYVLIHGDTYRSWRWCRGFYRNEIQTHVTARSKGASNESGSACLVQISSRFARSQVQALVSASGHVLALTSGSRRMS